MGVRGAALFSTTRQHHTRAPSPCQGGGGAGDQALRRGIELSRMSLPLLEQPEQEQEQEQNHPSPPQREQQQLLKRHPPTPPTTTPPPPPLRPSLRRTQWYWQQQPRNYNRCHQCSKPSIAVNGVIEPYVAATSTGFNPRQVRQPAIPDQLPGGLPFTGILRRGWYRGGGYGDAKAPYVQILRRSRQPQIATRHKKHRTTFAQIT